MKRIIFTLVIFLTGLLSGFAQSKSYITFSSQSNSNFSIASNGKVIPFHIAKDEFPGVKRALHNLRKDLAAVTGDSAVIHEGKIPTSSTIVVAGTLGRNKFIDDLVKNKKLKVSSIVGKWEGFIITTVDKPAAGIKKALVIVGSDKRGTIFGIYDLAKEAGVSPWNWWADVPVQKNKSISFQGPAVTKIPSVQYRGIFINDEQPALGGWAAKNFGGFNHKFYEKVFELILRMKGNFLWPAMWGQSIYSDDPLSPELADEMGVVISTSHHEPMMRAHVEWQRKNGGAWNYNTNEAELREFWREGIKRMGNKESIVTLGMRGDGDEPMSEDANIDLLQRIVKDQREIITQVTGKPANSYPQVWALYKEVQEYYDKGMRVPDDVTLLLCDDNWGNIRKLPTPGAKPHPGGYGIYYHFDYVGDPRNYKWINTNPLPRIWEQMKLAWDYGARKIWIVNVGDIKPMEFPIEFFLDFAFDTSIPETALDAYAENWSARQFGKEYAKEIGRILSLYGKYNGRRKPELLGPDRYSPRLYSLTDYREAEKVVEDYNKLSDEAQTIYDKLAPEYKDAYYQLVLYPVKASANLNDLYYSVRLNRLYATQGRVAANGLAKRAQEKFVTDSLLTRYYNEEMAGGKWKHMMDQLHIGYIGWHDTFGKNTMPQVSLVEPSSKPQLGVAVEGSEMSWPGSQPVASLKIDSFNDDKPYVEIYNRGSESFSFSVEASPSVKVSQAKGSVSDQLRLIVSADWSAVQDGKHNGKITVIASTGERVEIPVELNKFSQKQRSEIKGFVERNGYIAFDASAFSTNVAEGGVQFKVLPDHGRTGSAITSMPMASPSSKLSATSAHVGYETWFANAGKVTVHAYFSPTIDFTGGDGLEFAVSIDDGEPVVLNLHAANTHRDWQESVKNNIRIVSREFEISKPGVHTIKFWRIDPGVVLQRIVVDCGGLKPSYLGPPDSRRAE